MKMKFQNLKLKTFFTILMFVLCIILGILVFCNWLNRDNIPPQISFENETLFLTDNEISEVSNSEISFSYQNSSVSLWLIICIIIPARPIRSI